MNYFKTVLNEIFELFPDGVNQTITHYSSRYSLVLKTALPYLSRNKEAKILDVGTGPGVIPLVLRKMGYGVSAVDTWEEYSEIYDSKTGIKEDIIERLERNGVQAKYCDIEKESFPFEDGQFDIVIFSEVIEHIHSSPKKALREIWRVLATNGVLILTTPNLAILKNRLRLLFGRSNHVALSHWFNSEPFFDHVREYTLDEVKKMLVWAGFDIKQARFENCIATPAADGIKKMLIRAGSNVKQAGCKGSVATSTASNFKLSPNILPIALYLLVTIFIPRFRYNVIVVGQKSEKF